MVHNELSSKNQSNKLKDIEEAKKRSIKAKVATSSDDEKKMTPKERLALMREQQIKRK